MSEETLGKGCSVGEQGAWAHGGLGSLGFQREQLHRAKNGWNS